MVPASYPEASASEGSRYGSAAEAFAVSAAPAWLQKYAPADSAAGAPS
jgi:hypothetical protein